MMKARLSQEPARVPPSAQSVPNPVIPDRLGGGQGPSGAVTILPLVLQDATVIRLREYAASRGQSIGELVENALIAFMENPR